MKQLPPRTSKQRMVPSTLPAVMDLHALRVSEQQCVGQAMQLKASCHRSVQATLVTLSAKTFIVCRALKLAALQSHMHTAWS